MQQRDVGDEFYKTYSCEICKRKTVPLTIAEAEKKNASVGAFIIRRHKITGEETRRSVVCHHCMKNVDDDRIYNKDKRQFMEFVGPEDLYDGD